MIDCLNLRKLLSTLSLCLDFSREGLGRHHQQVAYIGLNLAEEAGLSEEEKDLIFTAAIIHDAGVNTWQEKALLANLEVDQPWNHCLSGYDLVKEVDCLRPVAGIILYHHDRFGGGNRSGLEGGSIPLAARIIHLADRIDVLMKGGEHILRQRENIREAVSRLSGQVFDPQFVEVFNRLAGKESFWLDLTSPFRLHRQAAVCAESSVNLNEHNLLQISEMFARVIDRKSAFTHRHSQGVACVASRLARAMALGPKDVALIKVAGLLHDVGKLSIPEEILEKRGSLTPYEFAIIRQHTYYTYRILQEAGVPDPIPQWAAFHHERADGSGYPFHLTEGQIPFGSKIISVADVFTALREDRPYRTGMKKPEIKRIMSDMVSKGFLDSGLVNALFSCYEEIDSLFAGLSG